MRLRPRGTPAIKTAELNYELHPELIAQRPLDRRDAARLLVLHRDNGRLEHRVFTDLPEYLSPADCLVLNRSRVLPARFVARRATGGRIPGLFVKEASAGRWQVLLTGAGRLRAGETLTLEGGPWKMTLQQYLERGHYEVTIDPPDGAMTVLERVGAMPLPPYIRRDTPDDELAKFDREQYQTIYAAEPGSVAAPTAGLHFTPELLEKIRAAGTQIVEVLLHVGLGTFQPIEVEDLKDHRMHMEQFDISSEAVAAVQSCKQRGGRIVAVGTTSVRVLETAGAGGRLEPGSSWTDIFIYPPYSCRVVDALVTNFHLPGSTLLALVMAIAGREQTLRAYHAAIEQRYRFYSYGDAMLIV